MPCHPLPPHVSTVNSPDADNIMTNPKISGGESESALPLILSTVAFTFVCYFIIGVPMAVLPGFVDRQLGLGPLIAGLVIGTQYVSTILSRPYAGRLSDTAGAKATVTWGLAACGASGPFLLLADHYQDAPVTSLALLVTGRLILGIGESCVGTGAIAWAAGRLGGDHVSRIMSWNGIATYGALAVAAPLGVWIAASGAEWRLAPLGVLTLVAALAAMMLAWSKAPAPLAPGIRTPLIRLASRIAPHGLALALGSFGFGTIMTFVTLFYAQHGWSNAALAISAFSAGFVGARLLFAGSIPQFGGIRIAMVSLAVETVGLIVLALATDAITAAAGAAITGLGLSLVFPSLGTESVAMFDASDRGAAVGVFTLFLDLALACAGPLGGLLAGSGGYRSVFLWSAGASATACLIVTAVQVSRGRRVISRTAKRGP